MKNDSNTQIYETLPQIQEATISKIDTKKTTLRHIMIILAANQKARQRRESRFTAKGQKLEKGQRNRKKEAGLLG